MFVLRLLVNLGLVAAFVFHVCLHLEASSDVVKNVAGKSARQLNRVYRGNVLTWLQLDPDQ